jgi:hypothetical protein
VWLNLITFLCNHVCHPYCQCSSKEASIVSFRSETMLEFYVCRTPHSRGDSQEGLGSRQISDRSGGSLVHVSRK